ncbi:MAG TPA: hypothetical protein VHF92_18640 [Geodermatophilus sp.]|nr:hypothetical protein [Geodermatophilus sp.]
MPPTTGSTAFALHPAALLFAVGLCLLTACGGAEGEEAGDTPAAGRTTQSSETGATATTETGGATPTAHGSASATVTVTEDEWTIAPSEESFSAGSYTFEVVNRGLATHDLVIERNGVDVAASPAIAPRGASTTLTVTLEPGEYVFYCSVGDHRGRWGMELAVTVSE